MLIPGKLERAFALLKERREQREANIREEEIKLEKKDGIALLLGAMVAFLPLFAVLVAIALFCLYC